MKALIQLANRAKSLNINDLLKVLSEDKSFTDFIIELNTEKQLFEKGIDSTGRRLDDIGGGYSPYTIDIKNQKGQPVDRVTLKDTGDFYRSFRVHLDNSSDLVITADTVKDTSDLIVDWGANILGLTEDSLILLRLRAKLILIPYVKNVLLGA